MLLATGTDIQDLALYEYAFAEGEKGELRVQLSDPLFLEEIQALQDDILSQGVVLTCPIKQQGDILTIRFQKAIAPLIIIALAISALGVGFIIVWQLFKQERGTIALIAASAAVIAAVIYRLMK